MTNRRSIALSGDLGSGKSTISLQLASILALRRVSMGDVHRDMAQARGMSALQLNVHAERDEAVDDRVDQHQADMARSGEQLIVDSRLAWFFFTEAFKVHLLVDPAVAAQRVMSRPASGVESYSSIAEAIERLQSRSDSERIRFLRKYGVDKARLQNYDMVCDTTRARPDEITDDIAAAFNGTFGAEVLANSPPLCRIDPARIYPSQDIKDLRDLRGSDFVAEVRQRGQRSLSPILIAYTGRYFYVIDGHRRLSAALQSGFTLVTAQLIAEGKEHLASGLSAEQYFAAEVGLNMVYDWAAAHEIELSLPPHLADLASRK